MSNNAPIKTILILAANPKNTAPLRLDQEIREIDEGLRRANKREQYKLEQKWAVRSRDFYRAILDYQPNIVHFCGHGAGQDGIVLEDDTGKMALVQTDALASMFKLFAKKSVECVILNACYSEVQAEAISQYVNYVIGMNKAVGDRAAVAFAVAFYDGIAAGYEVEEAYELGRSQMMSFLEQETPVFKKKNLIDSAIDDNVITFEDVIPPNPYQGLSAFKEEDADFFFGQEKFVNKLVEVTRKQPLVAVVGPSGSGKSSVVYAGLIPKLRKEGNWLIESFRPGKQPFLPLASALVRQLEPQAGETQQLREAVGLAGDLQNGKITLQQVVYRILERNSEKRLLLVVDQFEELYTLCQVKEEQEQFADALLTTIAQENITLVLTLRADFSGYVLSYRPFRDALQEFTPQLLSSMKREELQQAIELPAQKLEVQLEPQLTQHILDDVGEEPGNLPLLEFALTRLWEKQINRELTHHAYQEIGGVKKAIANHAEQIYQKLSETEKKQAQRIFVQLVRPGEGTEDTRRVATRAEVGEKNWNLVSNLAGYPARLVVTGRHEQEDTVEVVHEALIREWGTLREWINANRQFRTWQERLKVALREWKNNNYDSGWLLRGTPLSVAEDWLRQRAGEMTQEEQDFIQVSARKQKRSRQTRNFAVLSAFIMVSGVAIFVARQSWELQRIQLGQSNALSQYSNELFNNNQMFDALLTSLRAATPLKRAKVQPSIQVVATLRQAVYEVKELNRWATFNVVNSVAFSPDGKTLAFGNAGKTIELWDTVTHKELASLKGHDDWVGSIAFSHDGKILVSSSGDKTIKLWNIETNQFITTIGKHEKIVTSIALNKDNNLLVSSSIDKTIKLWDVKTGKKIASLTENEAVYSVAFSPDGQTLALGSKDNTIKLWKVDDFKNASTKRPVTTNVRKDKMDKLPKVDASKKPQIFKGHNQLISSIAFSPDGTLLASGSHDHTLTLWNVKTGRKLNILKGHEKEVRSIAFNPNGTILASASDDNTIRLWNVETGQELNILDGHKKRVTSIAFNKDGNILVSGSMDNTVRFWDVAETQKLKILSEHQNDVRSIAFSHDGKTLASGSADNKIKLWDLAGDKKPKTLDGHQEVITSIALSPDSKTLASASYDHKIKLWDVAGDKKPKTLDGHQQLVTSVVFSLDGKTLASASYDHKIKLWDMQDKDKTLIATLSNSDLVNSVAFSPDSKTLASASSDKTIKLWNLQTQPPITIHTIHTDDSNEVYSVAFSPDGKTLASGGMDKTIRLWNVKTGLALNKFIGHKDVVRSIAFSKDGTTLVSGSADGTIRLWDVKTGEEISKLSNDDSRVFSVAFSEDGKTLASGSADGKIILWNFDFDDLLKRGCDWMRGYLENSPNVSDSDRHLCDGIP